MSELVEKGFYKSVDSARNHIGPALDSILMFVIGGSRTVGKGKNKKVHSWDHGNIFINHSLNKNIVRVDLNTVKDWNFIISQYQLMPFYLYNLSSRSYNLCEAVFYYARVNAKNFESEDNVLNINNRIIQHQPVNAVHTKGQFSRASFGKNPRFQIQLDKRPLSPGTSREASVSI